MSPLPQLLPLTACLGPELLLRVDGGARLGRAGAGVLLLGGSEEGARSLWRGSLYLGTGASALEAEYEALIEGLLALRRLLLEDRDNDGGLASAAPVLVQSDAAAVVRNLSSVRPSDGRTEGFARLHRRAEALLRSLPSPPRLAHISRELNREADGLAGRAMAARRSWVSEPPSQTPVLLVFRATASAPSATPLAALATLRVTVEAQGCAMPVKPHWFGDDSSAELESLEVFGAPAQVEVRLEDPDLPEPLLSQRLSLAPADGSDQDGLWHTVHLHRPLSPRLGILPSLAVRLALIPLDSVAVVHRPSLLADAELCRQVLRAVGRLGRTDWLFASEHRGRLLLEAATMLPSRRSTQLCLSLADAACFAGQDPASFAARVVCPMQREVLLRWLSRQKPL